MRVVGVRLPTSLIFYMVFGLCNRYICGSAVELVVTRTDTIIRYIIVNRGSRIPYMTTEQTPCVSTLVYTDVVYVIYTRYIFSPPPALWCAG